ncbi:MAG: DNA mismatch repair endonuclease MutL [Myxococcales bacterium]|nr:DNA mismatch repair endonuclease MutL [Myxococcales bacterium]
MSTQRADGTPRVQRLPDALVDRIAAGEVVERPASIVKELLENALDAGASRIRLEIRGGGRDWIAVSDDGCGMGPDDAKLALERHATSKIDASSDLVDIASYGFRGEALPAIASVSSLRLVTRPAGAALGYELQARAGAMTAGQEASAPEGTRIEVADLFEKVPARRKFLKSPQTEWRHIADVISRAAMVRPDVHFDVHRDERPAWNWPASRDSLDRLAAVLGEREAEALLPLSHLEGAVRVEGFVSRPDHHRSNAAGVYLFVNRRSVRDRLLQHALLEIYRDVLPRGRFPSAVLFLELPAAALDVNVHPAKTEVRFGDPQTAHRAVRNAVRKALAERSWVDPQTQAAERPGEPRAWSSSREGRPGPLGVTEVREARSDWLFAGQGAPFEMTGVAQESESAPLQFAGQRLLGQLLSTYLLLEAPGGLLLIDQHAAHERVLYEGMRAAWLEGKIERQVLLAPLVLALEPAAVAALAEHTERVEALGFEIESFGEDSVVLRALPALLSDRDPAGLVASLADTLRGEGATGEGAAMVRGLDPLDRIFASVACHAARRKGDALDLREQRSLLEALDRIPWAPTCPHGRPVVSPLDVAEIERRFARR